MISELLGAAQSLQSLGGLLKSASSLSNYNDIVLAVSEVNIKLMQANAIALSAQEQQVESQRRIRDLEHELQSLKAWRSEAAQLERVQIGGGVFAYLPQDRAGAYQALPKYCATCYLQNRPSLLQESREPLRCVGLNCNVCGAKLVFTHYHDAT